LLELELELEPEPPKLTSLEPEPPKWAAPTTLGTGTGFDLSERTRREMIVPLGVNLFGTNRTGNGFH